MTALLPWYVRVLALAVLAGAMFLLGQLHGERVAGEAFNDYRDKQATQTVRINQAQTKVVMQTEIKYRDRITTITKQGETVEKEIPVFVTAGDNAACAVNAGFVRIHDSAWTGDDPGPAAITDRAASGISLAEVAETNADNATSCRIWREQALGLREFYQNLQKVTNARTGPAKGGDPE